MPQDPRPPERSRPSRPTARGTLRGWRHAGHARLRRRRRVEQPGATEIVETAEPRTGRPGDRGSPIRGRALPFLAPDGLDTLIEVALLRAGVVAGRRRIVYAGGARERRRRRRAEYRQSSARGRRRARSCRRAARRFYSLARVCHLDLRQAWRAGAAPDAPLIISRQARTSDPSSITSRGNPSSSVLRTLAEDRAVPRASRTTRRRLRPVEFLYTASGPLASDCIRRGFVGAWEPAVHRIRVKSTLRSDTRVPAWTRSRGLRSCCSS